MMIWAILRTAGEMAEWSKAHAWKVCVPNGTAGSNPALTASKISQLAWGVLLTIDELDENPTVLGS
jgi:hypothetical protein